MSVAMGEDGKGGGGGGSVAMGEDGKGGGWECCNGRRR